MDYLFLLLTHLAYAGWVFLHPRIWIPIDAKAMKENGSADTLLQKFHRVRGFIRFLLISIPALLCSLPLWGSWSFVWSTLGLCALHGGYWFWYFNPRLNIARNEAYIGPYHVSWNPKGAWFDTLIWTRAWQQVRYPNETYPPAQEDFRVIAVAAPMYKKLLRNLLFAGCGGYALSGILILIGYLLE